MQAGKLEYFWMNTKVDCTRTATTLRSYLLHSLELCRQLLSSSVELALREMSFTTTIILCTNWAKPSARFSRQASLPLTVQKKYLTTGSGKISKIWRSKKTLMQSNYSKQMVSFKNLVKMSTRDMLRVIKILSTGTSSTTLKTPKRKL